VQHVADTAAYCRLPRIKLALDAKHDGGHHRRQSYQARGIHAHVDGDA
jgi:hypothetical protein